MFKKLIRPSNKKRGHSPQPGAGPAHSLPSSPLPEVLPPSSAFYPGAKPAFQIPPMVQGPAAAMAAQSQAQRQGAASGSPRSVGEVHLTAAAVGSAGGQAPYKTVRNSIYRGGLVNQSIRDGYGICKWEDGNFYDGHWQNDKRHGQGYFVFGETGDRYDGQWVNGRAHGYGIMTWTKGTRYEGLWECNKRCGQGTFYYLDGIVYQGEWKDNKRNGRGMVLYPNGSIFVGEFVDDMILGTGRYFSMEHAVQMHFPEPTKPEEVPNSFAWESLAPLAPDAITLPKPTDSPRRDPPADLISGAPFNAAPTAGAKPASPRRQVSGASSSVAPVRRQPPSSAASSSAPVPVKAPPRVVIPAETHHQQQQAMPVAHSPQHARPPSTGAQTEAKATMAGTATLEAAIVPPRSSVVLGRAPSRASYTSETEASLQRQPSAALTNTARRSSSVASEADAGAGGQRRISVNLSAPTKQRPKAAAAAPVRRMYSKGASSSSSYAQIHTRTTTSRQLSSMSSSSRIPPEEREEEAAPTPRPVKDEEQEAAEAPVAPAPQSQMQALGSFGEATRDVVAGMNGARRPVGQVTVSSVGSDPHRGDTPRKEKCQPAVPVPAVVPAQEIAAVVEEEAVPEPAKRAVAEHKDSESEGEEEASTVASAAVRRESTLSTASSSVAAAPAPQPEPEPQQEPQQEQEQEQEAVPRVSSLSAASSVVSEATTPQQAPMPAMATRAYSIASSVASSVALSQHSASPAPQQQLPRAHSPSVASSVATEGAVSAVSMTPRADSRASSFHLSGRMDRGESVSSYSSSSSYSCSTEATGTTMGTQQQPAPIPASATAAPTGVTTATHALQASYRSSSTSSSASPSTTSNNNPRSPPFKLHEAVVAAASNGHRETRGSSVQSEISISAAVPGSPRATTTLSSQSPHHVSFAPEPVLAPASAAPESPRVVGVGSPRSGSSYLNLTQQSSVGSCGTSCVTTTMMTQRSASTLGRTSSVSSVGASVSSYASRDSAYVASVVDGEGEAPPASGPSPPASPIVASPVVLPTMVTAVATMAGQAAATAATDVTEGTLSTTMAATARKTLRSPLEVRLQRKLLHDFLLAHTLRAEDDVKRYLAALHTKGYDNLLALRLRARAVEDLVELGVDKAVHASQIFSALQSLDPTTALPPLYHLLHHFLYALFEFASLEDEALLAYVRHFEKRLNASMQENLMGLTEHEISINVPLLEGHRLALFYVRRRMIERAMALLKRRSPGVVALPPHRSPRSASSHSSYHSHKPASPKHHVGLRSPSNHHQQAMAVGPSPSYHGAAARSPLARAAAAVTPPVPPPTRAAPAPSPQKQARVVMGSPIRAAPIVASPKSPSASSYAARHGASQQPASPTAAASASYKSSPSRTSSVGSHKSYLAPTATSAAKRPASPAPLRGVGGYSQGYYSPGRRPAAANPSSGARSPHAAVAAVAKPGTPVARSPSKAQQRAAGAWC